MNQRTTSLSSICITALFVMSLHGICFGLSDGQDWPNWRGPDHNGISNESDWANGLSERQGKVLWTALVGTGFSSFSVSDGRAYTMGNQGPRDAQEDVVYCFDSLTGQTIWSFTYPSPLAPVQYEGGPNATPTVDGDRVYTWGKNAKLHCFDAKTGKLIWDKDLQAEYGVKLAKHGLASSPLVVGDLLILNGIEVTLALDKTKEGTLVWKTPTGPGSQGAGYSTPVPYELDGQPCLAVFQAEGALGLTVDGGKVLWEFPWETAWNLNVADPVIAGNRFFLSSGYNAGCVLFAVENGTPKELWRNKEMDNHFNSSVFYKGHLYGFDQNILRCLDIEDGSVKWSQEDLGKGSLIIAGGKLVVLSERGKLVIADAVPTGFQPVFEKEILENKCWTPPVLSHGKVYARNARGDVVCVDLTQ